jgi:DNA-binding IclR family transcriptional regulator
LNGSFVSKRSNFAAHTTGQPLSGVESDEHDERYRAPALDKGLDILETLAGTDVPLSQAQIAKAIGRTPSEIYRMIDRLVRRGYLARTDSDRYELTLKLFSLGQQQSPRRQLVSLAQPIMRDFVATTGQSCHLSVSDFGCYVVIAQVDAPSYWGISLRPGARLGLLDGSSGRVLLAFQPPQERERMLTDLAAAIADDEAGIRVRDTPSDLEAQLADVRRRGHDRSASGRLQGVTGIAAPVLGPLGNALAALGTPYAGHNDPDRPDLDGAAELLMRAAETLGAMAGSGAAAAARH